MEEQAQQQQQESQRIKSSDAFARGLQQ